MEEEKEEKQRQLVKAEKLEEEERAERQRREEEEREERRRLQDEEREARRQEREIRKLQHEADLMRQKEAAEAAKREHELELARLAATNGDGRTAERDDRAKAPKLPLALHLRERAPETLAQIAKIADQYLEAHGKHLFSPVSRKPVVPPEREEAKNTQSNSTALQCFKCNTLGHRAANCPTIAKRCFLCGKQGHEARNCRSGGRRSGRQSKDGNPVQRG